MKKVLIVSAVPTHPVNAGNRMWIIDNCKILESLGCDIYFLYVYVKSWGASEEDTIEKTRDYWGDKFLLYKASLFERIVMTAKKKIHKLLHNFYVKCDDRYPVFLSRKVKSITSCNHFDICIVQYHYLTKLFDHVKFPFTALATHDNFSYKDLVCNQRVSDCLDANESAKAMQRVNFVFSLNSREHIFFEMLSPRSKVYTVYSYYEYHPQPIANNKNILFLSGASPFNMNGLQWFLDEIFPLIIKKIPECKLIIGGSICNKLKHLETHRNVIIQGLIDDVDKFYRQGDICINPTYQGTGLKTKTFEAVSYDKIEIAHPHSSIGIFEKEMAPILFSDKAEDWVNEIDYLLNNSNELIVRKKENEKYIKSLQQYVINQYKDFLNHC